MPQNQSYGIRNRPFQVVSKFNVAVKMQPYELLGTVFFLKISAHNMAGRIQQTGRIPRKADMQSCSDTTKGDNKTIFDECQGYVIKGMMNTQVLEYINDFVCIFMALPIYET